MSDLQIGQWVKRKGAFRRHVDPDGTERWTGPRWHLVESVVAEDAVTRCGKRMDRVTTKGELEVRSLMPLTRLIAQPQLCRAGCQRAATTDDFGSTLPTEDDGSTHEDGA
jgi:hypothetical protein